jgi:hypothetical protein
MREWGWILVSTNAVIAAVYLGVSFKWHRRGRPLPLAPERWYCVVALFVEAVAFACFAASA